MVAAAEGPSSAHTSSAQSGSVSAAPTLMFDPAALPAPPSKISAAHTVKLSMEQVAALRASHTVMMQPSAQDNVSGGTISLPGAPRLPPPPMPVLPSAVQPPPIAALPERDVARTVPWYRSRSFVLALAALLALSLALFGGASALVWSNHRWIAPTVLASTDPRVVQVAATLQQETARKNELVLQKNEMEMRLREARKSLEVEEAFLAGFKAALHSDLDARRGELRRLQALIVTLDSEPDDPASTSKKAELDARLEAVRRRVQLLEAAESGRGGTYDALALRREMDRSAAAADKARDLSAALSKALADANAVLERKNALLASIDSSPYGIAIAGDAVLGFAPYENLGEMRVGSPLFACKTTLMFCREVGTVGETLPGEVRGTHPLGGKELRGQLVRLRLTEIRAAERPLLYANRAPL